MKGFWLIAPFATWIALMTVVTTTIAEEREIRGLSVL